MSKVNTFLGDSVGRTIVKLIIISMLVGMMMNVFGFGPLDVVDAIRDFFVRLWQSGWAALGRFGDWLILGATIVVPVFVLMRLLNYRKS